MPIALSDYWTERAERLVIAGEKTASDMLLNLRDTLEQAQKGLQTEIEAFYARYAKETGLSVSEVREKLSPIQLSGAKADIARYYREVERLGGYSPEWRVYLRSLSARAYMSRLEDLQLQVRRQLETLYRDIYNGFTDSLGKTYADSYYHSMYDQHLGFGFVQEFIALNTRTIHAAIQQKWLGENYSDRIWHNKEALVQSINRTFMQGVAQGWNPRKISKVMAKELGETTTRNTTRLARTEFNNVANQAKYDSYVEQGIINQYQYVATLDDRTSEICQELDGEIFDLKDKETGANYPPMHPNCRSTTKVYIAKYAESDLLKKATRLAKKPGTTEYYSVPANMSYKQWKESLKKQEGVMVVNDQKNSFKLIDIKK
jgi:SPP1 gp7 family putative phage head morphogenesis protein